MSDGEVKSGTSRIVIGLCAVLLISLFVGWIRGQWENKPQPVTPSPIPTANQPSGPSLPAQALPAQVGPASLKPGTEAIFFATNLPSPLIGLAAPRFKHGWQRIEKLLLADDFTGTIKECDGVSCHFLRAQTRVKVIDPVAVKMSTGEALAEVRVMSGHAENESVFVPASFLYLKPVPPDNLSDISKIEEALQKRLFTANFATMDLAFDDATKKVSPFGAEGLKLALTSKRFDFELAAMEYQHSARRTHIHSGGITAEQFDAIIWRGLREGWRYTYRDR